MACLGLLMGALAPGVSQLLQAGGDAWQAEVCSVNAPSSRAVVERDSGKSSSGHDLAAGHCPYCALQAGMAVLPSASLVVAAITPQTFALPAMRSRALPKAAAWSFAQPRAPPRG